MIENNTPAKNTRQDYHQKVRELGKKEYTLMKMQEYGFWPENLPTPYERQKNEKPEDFEARNKLVEEYTKIAEQIMVVCDEKAQINHKLLELKKQYAQTWDMERVRRDIATQLMKESIKRRQERKKQLELEKKQKTADWNKHKAENIVFIGKGYSGLLHDKQTDVEKLQALNMPVVTDDKSLAQLLQIEYKDLRFLAYHRDVVTADNYHRYTIPKRNGGTRCIAAPKSVLKHAQRKILECILENIGISQYAHGFLKGKSVVSGADAHIKAPKLLINMDIEDFFPTITFERVRGMFKSFGYSGYVASLLAMLCTYCERTAIDVRGQTRYVKTSERILPQGSPASPMITNIICRNMDSKIQALSSQFHFTYTRYADDMSFSFSEKPDSETIKKLVYAVQKCVYQEGFRINKKKTRYLKENNRQCVTGIVINNDYLGVPKKWVKTMRAALYNARKAKEEGALSAETIYEIAGMASWLQAVNAQRYQKLIDEALNLLKDCGK